MNLKEIFEKGRKDGEIITLLKKKKLNVPAWEKIRRNYEPNRHKIVRDYRGRPNRTLEDGTVEKSTRYRFGFEKLLTSRMAGFMFDIPVKRVYNEAPAGMSEEQKAIRKQVINAIEKVYKNARVDNENIERAKQFFSGCEIFTLWYTRDSKNQIYGFPCDFKFKCKTYSPMDGNTRLYPIFDDHDDLIAMSIEYSQVVENETVSYFETWTKDKHYKWQTADGGWKACEGYPLDISSYGKIPGVYMHRTEPIFTEDLNYIRENIEYKLSENSDTISDNAAPIVVTVGEITGMEKRSDSKRFVRCASGGSVSYVTWDQGVDSMKYHVSEAIDIYFMLAQLPNISSSKMAQLSNVSYESRQMLFADAHMKVHDESRSWLEFLEREFNVVKQFVKEGNKEWEPYIDQIECDHVITPFIQNDKKTQIDTVMRANGDKPVMSQKTAIKQLDFVDDADAELAQIQEEEKAAPQTQESNPFGMFTAN